MSEPYSLFLVQTPLQLLNVIEAQEKFKKEGKILLFYRQKYDRSNMQSLLGLYEIEHYSFFRITPLFRLTFILQLFFRYASLQGNVQTIFFGTYASWCAFLVNFLRPDKLVLVDDGCKTINILKNPEMSGVERNRGLPILSKAFISRASFFTYYSDFVRSYGREAVQNSLEYVTQVSGVTEYSSLSDDSIIFIGTNVLNSYNGINEVLKRIVATAQGRKILYIMHRYDDPERLAELQQLDEFEAVRFDYPLELIFGALWRDNKPEVWTLGTTAIDTLALIYPELKAKVFELDYQCFHFEKRAVGFRGLIEFYRTQPHIEVVSDY